MLGFAPLSAFPISAFPSSIVISSGVVGTGRVGTLTPQVRANLTGVAGTGIANSISTTYLYVTLVGVKGTGVIHACYRKWSSVDTTGC